MNVFLAIFFLVALEIACVIFLFRVHPDSERAERIRRAREEWNR